MICPPTNDYFKRSGMICQEISLLKLKPRFFTKTTVPAAIRNRFASNAMRDFGRILPLQRLVEPLRSRLSVAAAHPVAVEKLERSKKDFMWIIFHSLNISSHFCNAALCFSTLWAGKKELPLSRQLPTAPRTRGINKDCSMFIGCQSRCSAGSFNKKCICVSPTASEPCPKIRLNFRRGRNRKSSFVVPRTVS